MVCGHDKSVNGDMWQDADRAEFIQATQNDSS